MPRKVIKKHAQYGFLTVLEIFQLSLTLFLTAILVSFGFSNLFYLLDKEMDKARQKGDLTDNGYHIAKAAEVFLQLFMIVVAYYYIEVFLYKIPSVAGWLKDAYQSFKTARHAIHIVMIVILIEFNSSLQHNIHIVGDSITIVH